MEGVNHEAIGLAGHLKLGRLIVLWDDNRITIDGSTELSRNEDVLARYAASGLAHARMRRARRRRRSAGRSTRPSADARPSLIRCRTIIGYGAPDKQGTAATHGVAARRRGSRQGARGTRAGTSRRSKFPTTSPRPGARPASAAPRRAPNGTAGSTRATRRTSSWRAWPGKSTTAGSSPIVDELIAEPPTVATRKASEMALEKINAAIPATIGGSADLTGSNNTKTKDLEPLDRRQLRRPLHLLRHPRIRHGRGDERHGAARRRHPLWRHLPGVHRLCAPGDPPVGAAAGAGHLRHDPRFDRAWRGRADPPADRASAEPARDAGPADLPPGRRGRDRRMLGAGAGERRSRACSR